MNLFTGIYIEPNKQQVWNKIIKINNLYIYLAKSYMFIANSFNHKICRQSLTGIFLQLHLKIIPVNLILLDGRQLNMFNIW